MNNQYKSNADSLHPEVALILIDVINDFDFPNGKELLKRAIPVAKNIAALKKRTEEEGIATIYVNDNFGRWRSDFRAQVERCAADDRPGKPVADLLKPSDKDFFVLKPMHSGFYCTVLPALLEQLGAKTLILAGFASNICVLFTAHDAHMRKFKLVIPADCSAAETDEDHQFSINQLKSVLKANVDSSSELNFEEWLESARLG